LSACQIHLISVKNAGYANVNDTVLKSGPFKNPPILHQIVLWKFPIFTWSLQLLDIYRRAGWQFYFEILMDGLFISLLNYCPILTADDFPYFRILNFKKFFIESHDWAQTSLCINCWQLLAELFWLSSKLISRTFTIFLNL